MGCSAAHVRAAVALFRHSRDGAWLTAARRITEHEMTVLQQPQPVLWWRLRPRSSLLSAMLELVTAETDCG
jgi:hypothetical protein